MAQRELYKVWEQGERKWQIGKFDAMTGSYVAYKLMSELLPMGIGQQLGIPAMPDAPAMSRKDFFELQRDCLNVCGEILPSRVCPILDKFGNFEVIGLENDAPTVLSLTIQALIWNVKDFFDEKLLDSLRGAFRSMIPSNASMLTNDSTPQ
jgi:hypothetical protein